MSDQEIVREYLAAKDPGKQIRILADENLCTPETIRNILRREAVPVGRKEPKAKPEPAPAPEPPEAKSEPKPAISRDIALSMIVRHAAIEAIAELMAETNKIEGDELKFRERVRGVLCLVHTLEKEDLDDAEG